MCEVWAVHDHLTAAELKPGITEMAGAELKEFTHLEGNQATWLIPPARSKNGRAHVVPLSSMARAIVQELVYIANRRADELVAAARFLLVSPAGADQPIDGHALSVAMARFGKAFDLKEDDAQKLESEFAKAAASWFEDRPTAHDLRRTLATRVAALGIPAEDVKACLNHARSDVTGRHYDQYDRLREKHRALELWSEQVQRIIDGGRHQMSSRCSRRALREPPNSKT